jgi:predicted  nucleic acid-binding Zn-ribbon protein
MSNCLSQKDGVIAAKPHRCDLCGEVIQQFAAHDVRSGISDGWYKMRMHPECHRYEQSPEMHRKLTDWDWYEDVSEPAFERADAVKFSTQPPAPLGQAARDASAGKQEEKTS